MVTRKSCRSLRTLSLLAVLLGWGCAALANGEDPGRKQVVPELQLPVWRELYFETSRRWASASTQVSLHRVPARQFLAVEVADGAGDATSPMLPADGDDFIYALMLDSRVARNRERISHWFDGRNHRSLQRCRLSEGRTRSRTQCYRYYSDNISRERREGDAPGKGWSTGRAVSVGALTDDWRVTSRIDVPYPSQLPAGTPVVLPQSLLVLAGAVSLREPGDHHQVVVHTDRDFYQVTLIVTGQETVRADHAIYPPRDFGQPLVADSPVDRFDRTLRALVIELHAEPLGEAVEPFEFFGLGEPVRLLLDPETRLPLEVRGNAPRLGDASIGLRAVRMAAGGASHGDDQ